MLEKWYILVLSLDREHTVLWIVHGSLSAFSKRKADILNLLPILEKSILNSSLNLNVFTKLPLIILVNK